MLSFRWNLWLSITELLSIIRPLITIYCLGLKCFIVNFIIEAESFIYRGRFTTIGWIYSWIRVYWYMPSNAANACFAIFPHQYCRKRAFWAFHWLGKRWSISLSSLSRKLAKSPQPITTFTWWIFKEKMPCSCHYIYSQPDSFIRQMHTCFSYHA